MSNIEVIRDECEVTAAFPFIFSSVNFARLELPSRFQLSERSITPCLIYYCSTFVCFDASFSNLCLFREICWGTLLTS